MAVHGTSNGTEMNGTPYTADTYHRGIKRIWAGESSMKVDEIICSYTVYSRVCGSANCRWQGELGVCSIDPDSFCSFVPVENGYCLPTFFGIKLKNY